MKRTGALAVLAVVLGWGLAAVPLPPPLETGHILGRGLAAGQPPLPLEDELYALGWSRDNRFAALERRTLAPGRKELRLRVLDLVDDVVVEERTWDDWGPDGAREAWWLAHAAEIDGVFAQFALEPIQRQLGLFPLIVDNEYFSLVLRTEPVPGRPGWLGRLEALVNSTGRGLKSVAAVEGFWRWAAPLGFVPSPFENRLALIVAVQPAGWAGEGQPLRFLIVGLSLKAGFPKP